MGRAYLLRHPPRAGSRRGVPRVPGAGPDRRRRRNGVLPGPRRPGRRVRRDGACGSCLRQALAEVGPGTPPREGPGGAVRPSVVRATTVCLLAGCTTGRLVRPEDLDPTLLRDDVHCVPGYTGRGPLDDAAGPDACRGTTLHCDETSTPLRVTLEVPPPSYTFACPTTPLGPRAARAWRAHTWLEIRRQQGHASLCLGFEELARRAVSAATSCAEAQHALDQELARNQARQDAFAAAWDRAHPPAALPAASGGE